MHCNISIVSITDGVVEEIKNNAIYIYIAPEDNHDIYAPASGVITGMVFEDGYFRDDIFRSSKDRRGKTRVFLNAGFTVIPFYAEVGKGYITDRIRIDVKVDDFVRQSSIIGEIMLGSRSQMQLTNKAWIVVKKGDKLTGGKTVVATMPG